MKHIAILVETTHATGQSVLEGISRYLDERPDWSVCLQIGPLGTVKTDVIKHWQGDGIIARVTSSEILEVVEGKKRPSVGILSSTEELPFPLFLNDEEAIGKTVADHFIENGHQNFAFLGRSDKQWSMGREEGFKKAVELHGQQIQSLNFEKSEPSEDENKADDIDLVKKWLGELPKPIAVMVANDQLGPLLFEACHQLKLSIPEDVSVIGVDNDPSFCNLCRPRLSSVKPDHEKVGYLAAKGLAAMIDGKAIDESVIEISSHVLHHRASSDMIAISDPAMLKALKYIRKHAHESPSLDRIAEIAAISRSVLQRRFRKQFDRTVGDAILHEKLRIAGNMLVNTKVSLSEVAERSGFNCQEYMNHIFKVHLKTTPKKYRLQ